MFGWRTIPIAGKVEYAAVAGGALIICAVSAYTIFQMVVAPALR